MDFTSDNASGIAPEILAALGAANAGQAPSYGADAISQRVEARLDEIFERAVSAFFVSTGSAANALALASLVPPYGAVLTHEASHIQTDECGAPEFFTHGAKLIPLTGAGAKISPAAVEAAMTYLPAGVVHHVQGRAVSITQASECGTVYTPDEVGALGQTARRHGLKLHMDGARFANAVAGLGCAPADITWRAGVDVLVLGATKNGALAAEAVIFFDPEDAADFAFRRKRAGHLMSKGRFLAAQLDAYFAGDLWLRMAAHANAMARALSDGLAALPGARIVYPTEANEVFAVLPEGLAEGLRAAGAAFHPWVVPGDPADGAMVRLVTSFATAPDDVERFLHTAQSVLGRLTPKRD